MAKTLLTASRPRTFRNAATQTGFLPEFGIAKYISAPVKFRHCPAAKSPSQNFPIRTRSNRHVGSGKPIVATVPLLKLQCVKTRTKPCLDGLKTESGMEIVFNVPSPMTFV